jgi:hypothetical protein
MKIQQDVAKCRMMFYFKIMMANVLLIGPPPYHAEVLRLNDPESYAGWIVSSW